MEFNNLIGNIVAREFLIAKKNTRKVLNNSLNSHEQKT